MRAVLEAVVPPPSSSSSSSKKKKRFPEWVLAGRMAGLVMGVVMDVDTCSVAEDEKAAISKSQQWFRLEAVFFFFFWQHELKRCQSNGRKPSRLLHTNTYTGTIHIQTIFKGYILPDG